MIPNGKNQNELPMKKRTGRPRKPFEETRDYRRAARRVEKRRVKEEKEHAHAERKREKEEKRQAKEEEKRYRRDLLSRGLVLNEDVGISLNSVSHNRKCTINFSRLETSMSGCRCW